MTCRDFIEYLWKYVSDELPPKERSVFDAHLAICPDCVGYLSSYRETIRMGQDAFPAPDEPVPAEVPEDLIRAILDARSKGQPSPRG